MDLSVLNQEQRLVAETLNGPLLVLAGAGSGKTRALTYRVANLIDHGVEPWHILALTFTNKAAKEMRERISALVGEKAEDAWVSTFHATCARILRRDIDKIGYTSSFVIYDDDDQMSIIKDVIKRKDIDDKLLPPREVKAKISDAKNKMLNADEWFQESLRDYRSQMIHDVFKLYEDRLKASNALDFDDLINKTLELFLEHPPVLENYQRRFEYVHVDEYQDTNTAQYMLVKLITKESRNLCVVGDDDQSIYGWRGADIRNILDFEKDFPEAVTIKLERNYRSTSNILDAANQVIAHNVGRKEKALWTEEEAGDLIKMFIAGDEREEAAWVCDRIHKLSLEGIDYGSCAILYRTNAQSRVLEEMLMRAGIPYRVFGGLRFYDRKEVRDAIAYLRVVVNPSDDVSLKRIINQPKRSIGDATIGELSNHAIDNDMPMFSALVDLPETLSSRPRKCVTAFVDMMNELIAQKEGMGLAAFVEYLLSHTGLVAQYEKEGTEEAHTRIENLMEFLSAVTDFEKNTEDASLEAFLENVALITDLDRAQEANTHVTLMTLHSAKGLEFPTVFMTGLEEGIFPSGRSVNDEDRLEEERRLCYVGITRAREKLHMSRANQRMIYNQMTHNAPSRFLDEIPKRLLDDEWSAQRLSFGETPKQQHTHNIKRREAPGFMPMGAAQTLKATSLGGASVLGSSSRSATLGGLNIPGVQKGFAPSNARPFANGAMQNLFKPGDRVLHKKFGEGCVIAVSGTGGDARICIAFTAYGQKEFALSIAPIVKVGE